MKKARKIGIGLASAAVGFSVLAGATTFAKAKKASSQPPLVIVAQMSAGWQANFNPYSGTVLDGTNGLIYESLFDYNTVGPQVYPLLGTKSAWSNGNKTLTVDLRKGVKWSDGKAFTADDVIFTFNMLKKNPAMDGNGLWQQLSGVKKINDFKVEFDFKKVSVPFAYYVLGQTFIVPQHIWSNIKDPAKDVNASPVGTGPYTLKSINTQVFYMQANPKYWGGEPAVKTLEFPNYTGNDSAQLALASGKLDWVSLFIPNIDKLYVSRDKANNHYWFPAGAPVMLYTNQNDPQLSDLAVRKALSLAIDRNTITKVAEYGYAQVASPTSLLPSQQATWLDPKLPAADKSFKFDPAAAAKVLEAAGYKKGADGIYAKNGKELHFTLNVVAGWTDWDESADMISKTAKQAGIQIDVKQLDFGAYYDAQSTGKYQLSMSWSTEGPTPFSFYQGLMYPGNGNNFEKWIGDGASKLALDTFNGASSLSVQKAQIYKLQRVVAEQLPSIPLFYGPTWYEYSTKNFVGWPSASNPYIAPAPYLKPDIEMVLRNLKPKN